MFVPKLDTNMLILVINTSGLSLIKTKYCVKKILQKPNKSSRTKTIINFLFFYFRILMFCLLFLKYIQ